MRKLKYMSNELMAIVAARGIKNTDIVFCGTGLPIVAAFAAKLMNAPESVIFFETGAIDPALFHLPMFVADSRVMVGSSINSGLIDALSILQNNKIGFRIVALLGAAQIDEFGNFNSTCIGEYTSPEVRLPGSGGAPDAACLAGRTVIFMKHEKRRFVRKLDYVTSPGWVRGGESRYKEGLSRGGISEVITEKCVLKFRNEDRKVYLSQYFSESELEDLFANTGFEVDTSQATKLEAPTEKELLILRTKVDPDGLILSRNK